MNADVIKGKWHQLKGRIKTQWGKLTDDDIKRIEGNVEEAVGRLQERYGYARDEARREWDAFCNAHCGDEKSGCGTDTAKVGGQQQPTNTARPGGAPTHSNTGSSGSGQSGGSQNVGGNQNVGGKQSGGSQSGGNQSGGNQNAGRASTDKPQANPSWKRGEDESTGKGASTQGV